MADIYVAAFGIICVLIQGALDGVSCRRNRTNTQSSLEISSPQNVAQKRTVSDDVDDQHQHDKIASDSKDRSKAKRSWRSKMGRKERLKAGEADLQ